MNHQDLPLIAFDESGNTGDNLLDKNQPIFTLASVNYDIYETNELLGIFKSNSDEIHFKRIKRRSSSHKQLIEFCNHSLINQFKVKYFVADKRLALIGHIVDRLIEPIFYSIGKNIYEDASNIIITNLLYTFSKESWNHKLTEDFLYKFQSLAITKTENSIKEFYASLKTLHKSIKNNHGKDLLGLILHSEPLINNILNGIDKYSLDLTYSTFNVLCDSWYKILNSNFYVLHDNSKQIEFSKSVIEFTSNPNYMDQREVGFGDNKMLYPLKIIKLEFVDSKNNKQIQIADLVASTVSYILNPDIKLKTEVLRNELFKTNLTNLTNLHHFSIRPISSDQLMEFIKNGNRKGSDSLDYLTEMFIKNEKIYKEILNK